MFQINFKIWLLNKTNQFLLLIRTLNFGGNSRKKWCVICDRNMLSNCAVNVAESEIEDETVCAEEVNNIWIWNID